MGTTLNEPTRLTLPQVATRLGLSLDTLRSKVRKRPTLAAMFEKIGGIRSMPTDQLPEFAKLLGSK